MVSTEIADQDGDTKIQVEEGGDDDDTIRFDIAGAEDFQMRANTFEVQTGSNIDMNGTELILDADGDTSVTADSDDTIDFRIAGADDFQMTANTFTALSGSTIATDTIAETTAANGIDIDGANIKDGIGSFAKLISDQLTSSGVNTELRGTGSVDHGLTTEGAFSQNTATYFAVNKNTADGSCVIQATGEGNGMALRIQGSTATAPATTPTTTSVSTIRTFGQLHNSANGRVSYAANANVISFAKVDSGGGLTNLFTIDEDGDYFFNGADGGAFDLAEDGAPHDDAALLRAWTLQRGPSTASMISPSRFDANRYSLGALERIRLVAPVTTEEWDEGTKPLVNAAVMGRIKEGAIWQQHEMLDAIVDTLTKRDPTLLPELVAAFKERGQPTQILEWGR
jgi:hypothetical protein